MEALKRIIPKKAEQGVKPGQDPGASSLVPLLCPQRPHRPVLLTPWLEGTATPGSRCVLYSVFFRGAGGLHGGLLRAFQMDINTATGRPHSLAGGVVGGARVHAQSSED